MANRNFRSSSFQLEQDVVRLYGRCAIGAVGAVSAIQGTGVSTITKESATGTYTVTLEDKYNKFLKGDVQIVCDADGTAKTCVSGTSEVNTFTFVATASCTSGDFAVITDTAGAKWAFAIDKTGSAPEPTSAIWSEIPAANKVNVDISGATTDANVATAVRAGLAGLSGIGTTLTVASSSGATIPVTHVLRAVVATAQVYKEDGSATPDSVTVAKTTTGIQTAIDPGASAECLTIPSHGFATGKSIALSIGGGSLPTGWSATTYFVIVVDANRIAFGTSLANAEAGTKVTISDYGTAAQTITVTPSAYGSGVAHIEFTDSSTIDAALQAGTAISFIAYDYARAPIQIANGSKMYIELVLRNSSMPAKGE